MAQNGGICTGRSCVCESLWKMKWLILGISFPFERDKRYWHVWMEETEGRLRARSWDSSCLDVCEPSGLFTLMINVKYLNAFY